MQPEELAREADDILRIVNDLGRAAAVVAGPKTDEIEMIWFGQALAEDSADAAARFGRMAVRRRFGVSTRSNDLNELADALEAHDVEREWEGLTEMMRGINGDTRRDHPTMCSGARVRAGDVTRAGRRLSILVPVLLVEFDHAALTPALTEVARSAFAELRRTGLRTVDRFPADAGQEPVGFGEVATAAREVLPSIRLAYDAVSSRRPALRSRTQRSPWAP